MIAGTYDTMHAGVSYIWVSTIYQLPTAAAVAAENVVFTRARTRDKIQGKHRRWK